METRLFRAASLAALACAAPVAAQDMSAFKTGPVIAQFGPHAPVEGIGEVPGDTEFSIAFDVAKPADEGARNRGFESAARFINMHVAHGVPEDNIRIAVVVHGKAVNDLLASPDNTSADMVQVMLGQGVRFIVCGQSAVAYGVTQDELLPGVEMALSAMTAHALLQQRGYTVNPF
ncbi:DsrE family protein [Qipengyuania seohaensis]|uniref:DsrE family protein n=1 Tax=Qipengyuania seohaensis TaxID=266951 RepID=UPI000C21DB68|nr:DsrE family protein [Qipengyuania seohaensis]